MKDTNSLDAKRLILFLLLIGLMFLNGTPIPTAHANTITSTQHVQLGFTTSYTIPHQSVRGGNDLFGYSLELDATATLQVHLEADVTLSYNTANIVAGGTLPVHLTYTPTSSSAYAGVAATAVVNFWPGCGNCPATLHMSAWTRPMSFTPPLDSDQPVTIPISSDTVYLHPLLSADVGGSFTFSPATYWRFTGLGGASTALSIDGGASLTGSLAVVPLVEWDHSGQTQDVNIQLPNPLPADFHLTMMPMLHWLGTSADIHLNVHMIDALNIFSDPWPQGWPLFSGNLGSLYHDTGLDNRTANAIPNALAADLVATRIRAGFVPVPLLQPPWGPISLTTNPTLGRIVFDIQCPTGFLLIYSSPSVSVLAGNTAPYAIGVGLLAGTPTVTLSVVNDTLPKGAKVGIKPGLIFNTNGTASVDVYTSLSSLGDSAIVIQAVGGGVTRNVTLNLHVYDFSVEVFPSDVTVYRGDSAYYIANLTLKPGSSLISNAVSLSLPSPMNPADATGTFGSTTITPALAPGASTTLTVATAPAPGGSVGNFAFTVTGTDPATAGIRQADPANLHILAGSSPIENTTWTGAAGNGRWDDPGNWNNGVPTSGIRAYIPHDAYAITISTPESVLDLGVGSGDTLTCTGSCSLTVVDVLGNLGTIHNSGTITVAGLANIGGGIFNNLGTVTVSGEFANDGTFCGTANKSPEGSGFFTPNPACAVAPVGGVMTTADSFSILAPWIAALGIVVCTGVVFVAAKKRRS